MTKLRKIDKDIQIKFIIGFLALVVVFAFFFWFFIREQQKTIVEQHVSYVKKADATIATLLGQARLNSLITAKEVAAFLKRIEDGEVKKENLLEHLESVEKREEAAGILLAQHILLTVDMNGSILVRSEWVKGKRVELEQKGHVKDGWKPSVAFEQAFENALKGRADVRKIIYDRDFLKREGYDFWNLPGMGLTVMTPIMDNENKEQKGVLISVTFLNENAPVIAGLKAVTDVSFVAILPSGEIIGSIFDTDSTEKIEKISRSSELLAAAKEKAAEKAGRIRMGENVPDTEFVLEEFTIEKIKLTRDNVFGGESHYYRVVYWLELDDKGNFASLRGIAMDTDFHVAQENILIRLIAGINVLLLIIFGLFYFWIQKKLVRPITSFTAQLKTKKEDERLEIQKNYQEFAELEEAFNSAFNQADEARVVLEIKVNARTKQLSELSASLEKQVKEKTKDLQERVEELERFSNLTIGRETKMIELKEEIKRLKEEIKILKKEQ